MPASPKPRSQVQYEALQAVGFIQRIDKIVVTLLSSCWVVAPAVNWLCGKGILAVQPLNLTGLLLVSLLMLLLWLIVLVFRCMYFVIQLTAKVNLMPYEAARILEASKATGSLPPIPNPSATATR